MSKQVHTIESVHTDEQYLYLTIDTQHFRVAWLTCSTQLANATLTEKSLIDVSPSGYGLHWPMLDEDLAISPLLQHAEKIVAAPA